MKILRTFAILLSAICLSIPMSAQQTKVLTADKHNEYGLVYRLPLTALRIEVKARCTISKAGPYFQYAKRYIGTDKVIKEDSEKWEIISVNVLPYGTANPEKEYLMQLKPGAVTSICVADDGMLLAINTETEAPEFPELKNDVRETPIEDISDYLQYVDEDFLASQSSAKRAQMLAENILDVRDARISLAKGTADVMPTDGRQLELMLNSLSEQEKAMTDAFTGISQTFTETRIYTYTPETPGKEILFRLSDFAGFVEADDYSGEPVYISVDVTREGKLPVDDKDVVKTIPKDAVIYNIPGAAKVSLSYKGKNLWSQEIECAQYGVQFGLLPTLFSDKKSKSFAIFNPVTGALEKIGDVSSLTVNTPNIPNTTAEDE